MASDSKNSRQIFAKKFGNVNGIGNSDF